MLSKLGLVTIAILALLITSLFARELQIGVIGAAGGSIDVQVGRGKIIVRDVRIYDFCIFGTCFILWVTLDIVPLPTAPSGTYRVYLQLNITQGSTTSSSDWTTVVINDAPVTVTLYPFQVYLPSRSYKFEILVEVIRQGA